MTAAMTGLLGWRQRFLMQAAHRDDLDAHQIRTLVRQSVPDLDLDEVLAVLDEARQLHLAAHSLEAQALIEDLIQQQQAAENGGDTGADQDDQAGVLDQ